MPIDVLGSRPCKLDERWRLSIPAIFRAELNLKNYVYLFVAERCIRIYPPELVVGKVSKIRRITDSQRVVIASLEKEKLRDERRVVLPVWMRAQISLREKDVVVVAVKSYLEVWEKSRWEEEKAKNPFASVESLV